ncbi:MAG: methionine--tRNA ligase [Actinomycetota bacterium]
MTTTYLTAALPYVNASPHLGHALELVDIDAVARHWRRRGHHVRTFTGTDDNARKNVAAARAAGRPVTELVAERGDEFLALAEPLGVGLDDTLRTSTDPRHRTGVAWFWRRWHDAGDLYRDDYEGWYCTGCEAFLDDDRPCPEHERRPERVTERNWFFRLSRYRDLLRWEIERGRLRIEPEVRRNEVLATLDDLRDVSVSRPAHRSEGWGLPVPGDDAQVVYVWIEAVTSYLTALGASPDAPLVGRWWTEADRRVHVVGKGITRFHAVYWPALLASAGLPLPTDIWVHDHLTVEGRKLSKTLGTAVDPVALVDEHSTDAVRWWLLRHHPLRADVDFTEAGLADDAETDLADLLGNTVHRVVTLANRLGDGRLSEVPDVDDALDATLDAAVDRYDLGAAVRAVLDATRDVNRTLEGERPWELARDPATIEAARRVVVEAIGRCRSIVHGASWIVPDLAAGWSAQLGESDIVGAPEVLVRRRERACR